MSKYIGKLFSGEGRKALSHYEEGKKLANDGDYFLAIEKFDLAISLTDKYPEAHYHKGLALAALGHHRTAIKSYDQARQERSGYDKAEAARRESKQVLKQQKITQANKYYEAGNALSEQAEYEFDKGVDLLECHKYNEAIEAYNRAISLEPDYAKAYNNKGLALHDLNRNEEALVAYDHAISLKPDYVTYNNKGAALNALNRNEEALVALDRAISLKPDYATAYSHKGNALHDLNRNEEALVAHDRAISLKPDSASAFSNKGRALHDLNRNEEALVAYDRALVLEPNYQTSLDGRRKAFAALEQCKKHFSPSSVGAQQNFKPSAKNSESERDDSAKQSTSLKAGIGSAALKQDALFNDQGKKLHIEGKFQEAIKKYNLAIQLNSNNAEYYVNKAMSLNQLAMYEEAIVSADIALSLDNDNHTAQVIKSKAVRALSVKGNVQKNSLRTDKNTVDQKDTIFNEEGVELLCACEYQEALEKFIQAIKINPSKSAYYTNKATALNKLNRSSEAFVAANKALELSPGSEAAKKQKAEALSGQGQILFSNGRYQSALEKFDDAIKLNSNEELFYKAKALCLYNLKQNEEALDVIDHLTRFKADSEAYGLKAHILNDLKRYQDAIDGYDQAIEIVERGGEGFAHQYYYGKGNTLYELGNHQKAIIFYNKALELKPDYEEALNNKACALEELAWSSEVEGAWLDSQNESQYERSSIKSYEYNHLDAVKRREMDEELARIREEFSEKINKIEQTHLTQNNLPKPPPLPHSEAAPDYHNITKDEVEKEFNKFKNEIHNIVNTKQSREYKGLGFVKKDKIDAAAKKMRAEYDAKMSDLESKLKEQIDNQAESTKHDLFEIKNDIILIGKQVKLHDYILKKIEQRMSYIDELIKKEAELDRQNSEIDTLLSDPSKRAFYDEVRKQLNMVYLAATVVGTDIVASSKTGVTGNVGSILNSVSAHIPFIGSGVNLLGYLLTTVDACNQAEMVDRYAAIAVSSIEMATIADIVAKDLVQHQFNEKALKQEIGLLHRFQDSVNNAMDSAFSWCKKAISKKHAIAAPGMSAVHEEVVLAAKDMGALVAQVITKKIFHCGVSGEGISAKALCLEGYVTSCMSDQKQSSSSSSLVTPPPIPRPLDSVISITSENTDVDVRALEQTAIEIVTAVINRGKESHHKFTSNYSAVGNQKIIEERFTKDAVFCLTVHYEACIKHAQTSDSFKHVFIMYLASQCKNQGIFKLEGAKFEISSSHSNEKLITGIEHTLNQMKGGKYYTIDNKQIIMNSMFPEAMAFTDSASTTSEHYTDEGVHLVGSLNEANELS